MSEWRVVELGSVAELTVGFVGTMARHYEVAGIPFLRSQNVLPHRLDMTDVRFISQAFHRRIQKSKLRPGDVVTVRTGNAGITTVVPDWLEDSNCADLVITRPGPDLDARWLSYFMNSAATHAIAAELVGAVQQHFNVGAAKRTRLALPPLVEQQGIAEVLGALDDKITANNALAATADEWLRSRYVFAIRSGSVEVPLLDEFIVDFGEPFGGAHFVEPGIGRPLIRIRDLKTFESQVWTTETRSREVVVRPGDIVVGMDAEFRATAWLGEDGLLNQRVCRFSHRSLGRALVREAVKIPLTEVEAEKSATTVIHLNKSDIARKSAILPDREAIASFEADAEPVFAARVALAAENRALAATRDALLPQLMSGTLRVRGAEAAA